MKLSWFMPVWLRIAYRQFSPKRIPRKRESKSYSRDHYSYANLPRRKTDTPKGYSSYTTTDQMSASATVTSLRVMANTMGAGTIPAYSATNCVFGFSKWGVDNGIITKCIHCRIDWSNLVCLDCGKTRAQIIEEE